MPSNDKQSAAKCTVLNPSEQAGSEKNQAEGCLHILRGLISYHERMTMGNYPERDFYLEALRFAVECVEEKVKK